MTTKTLIMFKADEGMAAAQVARELAGRGTHPIVVAVNQILADELTDAMTTAADPEVQKDTHRVAHALGAVDVCSRLRLRIAELASGENGV